MNCPRENEIFEAIAAARWPEACDDELRAHAAGCATCGDLVLVATALAGDIPQAHVPASGAMWWRMQRREREEAARAASRTITIVQAISIAAAIAIVLTLLGRLPLPEQWSLPLLVAAAISLLAATVALYVAFAKD